MWTPSRAASGSPLSALPTAPHHTGTPANVVSRAISNPLTPGENPWPQRLSGRRGTTQGLSQVGVEHPPLGESPPQSLLGFPRCFRRRREGLWPGDTQALKSKVGERQPLPQSQPQPTSVPCTPKALPPCPGPARPVVGAAKNSACGLAPTCPTSQSHQAAELSPEPVSSSSV